MGSRAIWWSSKWAGPTRLRDVPFPVVQIEVAGDGLPLAKARNAGRRAARGEELVFLDVDCIPGERMTRVLADALSTHDALVCARVRYLSAPLEDGWTEASLVQASDDHPARVFPPNGFRQAAHPGLFWSLGFAVRAATFDRIGGFDEGFHGYGRGRHRPRVPRPRVARADPALRGGGRLPPRCTRCMIPRCSISRTSCATPNCFACVTGSGRCKDGWMGSRRSA